MTQLFFQSWKLPLELTIFLAVNSKLMVFFNSDIDCVVKAIFVLLLIQSFKIYHLAFKIYYYGVVFNTGHRGENTRLLCLLVTLSIFCSHKKGNIII